MWAPRVDPGGQHAGSSSSTLRVSGMKLGRWASQQAPLSAEPFC